MVLTILTYNVNNQDFLIEHYLIKAVSFQVRKNIQTEMQTNQASRPQLHTLSLTVDELSKQ